MDLKGLLAPIFTLEIVYLSKKMTDATPTQRIQAFIVVVEKRALT